MSIFRKKVLVAFALTSFTTLIIVYTSTRIMVTYPKLQTNFLNIPGQNISTIKYTEKASASSIFNEFRELMNSGARNAIFKNSRKLPGKTSATEGLTVQTNQNLIKSALVHTGNMWKINKRAGKYASSSNSVHKNKIRIVTYHIYHTALKWAAKKLDMGNCYHSSNCEVVYQGECSNEPVQADAVVFQGNNIPKDRPARLHNDQVFVFLNIESPQYLQQIRLANSFFNDFFNWTMTYKRDSDIPYLYGSVLPRNLDKNEYLAKAEITGKFLNYTSYQEDKDHVVTSKDNGRKNYNAIFRRKTKSSVWFVSHCGTASRRERYVSRMEEYTDIDIFGRCNARENECPKNNPNCDDNVKDTYKFFIAFENSLCEDYITEKVFKWFNKDILVVVRGARYYKRYLPEGTYIDADDFESPEDLAKFLTQLGSDEEDYLKYLKRKDNYIVVSEEEHVQLAYCNLCYKLNNLELFRKPSKNLHQWWNIGKCTRPAIFS